MSKSYKIAHDIGKKKWRSRDVQLRENVDFSALLLSERVLSGLEKAGFKKPSPIQVEAIPVGKFGRDLVVQAKSGTGKTLVFTIIALETLNTTLFRPQTLVIVPTREIATQVCSVIKAVSSRFKELICNSFIGGLPLSEDQGKAVRTQIAVGTPGRLKQLILMKSLPTTAVRLLVFDEADELLSGSCFKDDIEDIFKLLPDDKQVVATSATFNSNVKSMVERYLCDPFLVHLNRRQLALLGMVHYVEVVEHCPMPVIQYKTKLDALERILKTIKFAQCLLFVNGIQRVEILYKDVRKWGFSAAYMSSAKEQSDRLKAIDKLKRFKCKVLVSSNVTARGIDAENVDLVINFDLAYSTETYMHRVGRAGRYGTIGAAISIVDEKEILQLESIQREGSFKAFMLPDPIPKDLISNVPESDVEYIDIGRNNINSVDYSSGKNIDVVNEQLKEAFEVNGIDNISDNNCSSEKKADDENNEFEDTYETAVDTSDITHENVLSEIVTQSATAEIDNHDDTTKSSAECRIKVEKIDKDENAKIIHPKEQTDENLENRNTHNCNLKLSKTKNNLPSDIDQNDLLSCQSSDESYACDILKITHDLCEEDGIKSNNIEKGAQLLNELSATYILKNGFKAGDKKLKEIHMTNVSETVNIVESEENDFACSKQENIVNLSDDKLNNMIHTFIHAYESNKRMEPTLPKATFEEGGQQNENSGKKFITIEMINNLKSQNQEFLYKTFKNFQESNEDNTELIAEEVVVVHSKFEESSECKEIFLENTPQHSDKTEKENLKVAPADVGKPVVPSFLSQQLQESESDDSYFEDSDSVESISGYSLNSPDGSRSNDSESLISSSDSEDDSDSETSSSSDSSITISEDDSESVSSSDHSDTSSSASSLNDSFYHHNHSRTGRQNPSLLSESVNKHIRREFDPIYHSRIPQACKCCAAPLHYNIPLQGATRCPHMISEMNRRYNCIHQAAFNRGNDLTCMGKMVASPFLPCCCQVDFNSASTGGYPSANHHDHQTHSRWYRCKDCKMGANPFLPYCQVDFNSASTSGYPSANHPVTQHQDHQTHSRWYKCKDCSNRSCTSRGIYKKCKHQASLTNTKNHNLDCYLPTRHRCHPNTPGYHCENGQLCEMWYTMFYNQWLHILNVMN